MGTKIWYLYRDASNYKEQNHAVVTGEIDNSQIDRIMDSLSDCDGELGYFIPSQLGLDEERPGAFDEDDDHVWFELTRDGFEITDDPLTNDIDIEDLVRAFEEAKDNWDEQSAWERLAC